MIDFNLIMKLTPDRARGGVVRKWLLAACAVIVIGLLIWGISWATYARPPLPEAVQALESDDQVIVIQEPWLTFAPTSDSIW